MGSLNIRDGEFEHKEWGVLNIRNGEFGHKGVPQDGMSEFEHEVGGESEYSGWGV